MHPNGDLDTESLKSLIDWQISQGIDGFVVMGSTAEAATVTLDEHIEILEVAVDHVCRRVPVIAGTGANSTQEAILLTDHARRLGADACLSVVPYYNKPTQEGIFQHFRAIAEAVDIPLIVYDVPGRTVVGLDVGTIARLSRVPRIVGLKDATGDIGRAGLLFGAIEDGFSVYSGDDPSAAALMLLGAQGNISVTANVAPRLMWELCRAALDGDAERAGEVNQRLAKLSQCLFLETNPIPVKWALARMGLIHESYRLPLTPLSAQHRPAMLDALSSVGIMVSQSREPLRLKSISNG